jgi:zinc transporter ZupT
MSLSAEQHRALTFLTTAALNGATQPLLAVHGFIISGMVNRSLVTLSFEKFRAGGKMIKVRMVRITTAGRDALAVDN